MVKALLFTVLLAPNWTLHKVPEAKLLDSMDECKRMVHQMEFQAPPPGYLQAGHYCVPVEIETTGD